MSSLLYSPQQQQQQQRRLRRNSMSRSSQQNGEEMQLYRRGISMTTKKRVKVVGMDLLSPTRL